MILVKIFDFKNLKKLNCLFLHFHQNKKFLKIFGFEFYLKIYKSLIIKSIQINFYIIYFSFYFYLFIKFNNYAKLI